MPIIRNPDGFASTAETGERHGYFRRPLPFDYQGGPHGFFEGFTLGSSGIPFGWTNTNTNGTPALASGPALTQTLGGADNDASQMYPGTAVYAIGSGKRAHFRWRGKVDKGSGGTIGQEEVYIGVSSVQTTTNFINAGGTALAVDDFIGFASFDATTSIGCYCRKTDVESSESAATTYADATFMELGFDYDGTTVSFYKDATLIAQVSSNIPTAAVGPVLYVKAGAGHAKVLTSQYVWFAVER